MSDITIKTLNTLNHSNIQTQTLTKFFIFKMLKYDFKKPGILSNKIIHLKSLYYFKHLLQDYECFDILIFNLTQIIVKD